MSQGLFIVELCLNQRIWKLSNLLPVGPSRPELIATLAECHRLAKHSEERCLAYTAAIDALDDHGADAATVTRDLTHRSARQAKQVADTATQLASMPLMAAALARGEIGTEHVVAAANAAKQVSPEEADQLVDDAVAVPADLFLKRTRQWIGQHETGDEIEDRYQRHARNVKLGGAWATIGCCTFMPCLIR